ncbi:CHASE2 domain-containing protein [Chloroflexota bacterium]
MSKAGLLKRKRLSTGLLTAVTVGIICSLFFQFGFFHTIQHQSSDFLFKAASLNPKASPEENILIVAIDDRSLEKLGHISLWPRTYHAQLVDRLASAEARIITFDVLFAESTPEDTQFQRAIQNAGKVILPFTWTQSRDTSSVAGSSHSFEDTVKPLALFSDSALALGHANMPSDEDGIVRRTPLIITGNGNPTPSLALATAAEYLRRPQIIESPVENQVLSLAGRKIPVDMANNMVINYVDNTATSRHFTTVSYVDVLDNKTDNSIFKDKIILIGTTAIGLGDTFWTPMGQMAHGVEMHAHAINTILADNTLKEMLPAITISVIIILALFSGLAVLRLRVVWSVAVVICMVLAYSLIAFTLFDNGIMVNMFYPPLAIFGSFTLVTLYHATTESAEKKEIARTFGRYVSPAIVTKIMQSSEEGLLTLKGEEMEMTVMFADIRNFTTISEQTSPQELVQELNIYLSQIVKAVFRYGGIVNKFGGDSVMAVWNVPLAHPNHAESAIKAGMEAQLVIHNMRKQTQDLPVMEFGIGISSGKAVAGNMGAYDRLEYSVIGDTVNIAARLADMAPGGRIWINADNYRQLEADIKVKPLGPLSIKGKTESVEVYEVIDFQNLPQSYPADLPVAGAKS